MMEVVVMAEKQIKEFVQESDTDQGWAVWTFLRILSEVRMADRAVEYYATGA